MTRGLTFPTAARRVTTRRSLSRTLVQAEAAVTLARDDPLSFDKTRSVATIGTLLGPRFRTLTTHGPHEHDDTVQLSRRRRLRRGLERCAQNGSGNASVGRPPVGVRSAPIGLVRRFSGSFGFSLRCRLSCGPIPPIVTGRLSQSRRWQPRGCSTAAAVATPAQKRCMLRAYCRRPRHRVCKATVGREREGVSTGTSGTHACTLACAIPRG